MHNAVYTCGNVCVTTPLLAQIKKVGQMGTLFCQTMWNMSRQNKSKTQVFFLHAGQFRTMDKRDVYTCFVTRNRTQTDCHFKGTGVLELLYLLVLELDLLEEKLP